MVGKTFQTHFDDTIVTCFGPKADGSCILRIQGKPKGSTHRVTGHIEINLKSHHDLNKILQSNLFYDGVTSLKLAHFVGYVGESHVINEIKKGTLFDKLFLKTRSGKAPLANKESRIKNGNTDILNPLYGKSFDPEKMIALQNKKGQGIDLICKIEPTPPPPDWVTFEIKTVMKDKFGANTTPTGGKASEIQKSYFENINKHSLLAKESFYQGSNEYSLGKKERKILLNILESCEEKNLVGFKLTVGIDNKFNISNNNKYNQFYIIENLKND
ncbi:Uncharacterised protein [Proteus vulgaris]|uniref:Uncharacterized protein n=1 Tax=Proteus vulgaris TaxID=585 RepID=A0A379F6Z3_PROVU|nr:MULTISPECIES: hypothetical protein [Proteus]MDM3560072.1 hypothetical protein [Proteus vulgaris]UBH62438.1 hypothetical protein LA322_02440 [Proteus vulgaris]UWT99781.1 hypothetical protein N1711_14995 [Proteus vulgaris]SUC15387.1 Uncharacterised protein [Proteus vulgaris]VTP82268.1 Uncharacterised protein [Proteus vulgaris]